MYPRRRSRSLQGRSGKKVAFETSQTNIDDNDNEIEIQHWNSDNWEQIYLEAASEEELDPLEDGLPVKVMKFMGLPKSYTRSLYNDFVEDVTQIPGETAASLYNIVNWFCGENDDNNRYVLQREPKTKSSTGGGDAGLAAFQMPNGGSKHATLPVVSKGVEVRGRKPISRLNMEAPFENLEEKEFRTTTSMPIKIHEGMDIGKIPSNIKSSSSKHGLVIDDKSETVTPRVSESYILEIESTSSTITRPPSRHACSSETSLYYYGMSEESENEEGTIMNEMTATTTENELGKTTQDTEEVKRVTFASPSETNIYAYQDYTEDEVDVNGEENARMGEPMSPQENHSVNQPLAHNLDDDKVSAQEEAKMTFRPKTANCKVYHDYNENIIENELLEFENEQMVEGTDCNAFKDTGEVNSAPPSSTASTHASSLGDLEENNQPLADDTGENSKMMTSEPLTKNYKPSNIKEEAIAQRKKSASSTSEVQLQLNEDLKTLEDVVKKLYKSLNKKGPLTLVANFMPKEDGELSLKMGPVDGIGKEGNINVKIISSEASSTAAKNVCNGEEKAITTQHVAAAATKSEKAETTHYQENKRENKKLQKRRDVPNMLPKALTTTASPTVAPVSIIKKTSKPVATIKRCTATSPVKAACAQQVQPAPVSVSAEIVDKQNNNAPERPVTPLRSAIKQANRMPSLRPAASSHSMTRTSSCSVHNAGSADEKSPSRKTSRSGSKHILVEAPRSQPQRRHCTDKTAPQYYKIVETPNSQRFLVPIARRKPVVVAQVPRSNSQYIIKGASQKQQLIRPQTQRSNSSQIIHMNTKSQNTFKSHEQSKTLNSPPLLVNIPPPPTCPNPHLHPVTTATIIPPTPSPQMSLPTLPTALSEQPNTYRVLSPCSMHTRQFEQQNTSNQRDENKEHAACESVSDSSMVSSASSLFTGIDSDRAGVTSGGDNVPKEDTGTRIVTGSNYRDARISPASLSGNTGKEIHQQQDQNQTRQVYGKSATTRNQSKATSGKVGGPPLPPAPTRQYRTTIHIPSAPQKCNSYSAMFKEKQQQKQTVYVDLTSNGLGKKR